MKTAVVMGIYEAAWRIARPFLKKSPRLKKGYRSRCLDTPLPPADLWIQAASVGEAFLAVRLIKALRPQKPTRVLVTTNTDQGLEVLTAQIPLVSSASAQILPTCGYFPFDRPSFMEKAVAHIRPKLVIFMETEIWPGLLYALKRNGITRCIINGRLTPKSYNRYRWFARLLPALCINRVLAVSVEDGQRFSALFGQKSVRLMHNMKFDEISIPGELLPAMGFLQSIRGPLIVLGSIRKEEEECVSRMICRLKEKAPTAIIAIFPRHVSRYAAWAHTIQRLKLDWAHRSALSSFPVEGQVILWDTFGELRHAYEHADAVFIGGTLAPLGGQNFLEPLMAGVRPVIGPYWNHFKWVGERLFLENLVLPANNWKEAADLLIREIETGEDRNEIRAKSFAYLNHQRGGTAFAARFVERYL